MYESTVRSLFIKKFNPVIWEAKLMLEKFVEN